MSDMGPLNFLGIENIQTKDEAFISQKIYGEKVST